MSIIIDQDLSSVPSTMLLPAAADLQMLLRTTNPSEQAFIVYETDPGQEICFDDAGAQNDEPVKGVTAGDIRAWHDQYDSLLSSWAECRDLLSKERAITAKLVQNMREIEVYSTDMVAVNGARRAISDALVAVADAHTALTSQERQP